MSKTGNTQRPLVLWRHSVEGADSRRFTLTGMVRHSGTAAARPSDCDSRTTHKQTHLRSSAHSAADSREERPHMRPPARGARRGACAPPHLPFPRPSPVAASALWPCHRQWPVGHRYVVLVVRGTAVTSGRINAVKLWPMPYGRRAARGVGGVTRIGLHAPRRGARPCYRRRRAMPRCVCSARRGRLGCFML